jgi:hypothetical protein
MSRSDKLQAQAAREIAAVEAALRAGHPAFPIRGVHQPGALRVAADTLEEDPETLRNRVGGPGKTGRWYRDFGLKVDWGIQPDVEAEEPPRETDTPAYRREIKDARFWQAKAAALQKDLAATEHVLEEVSGIMSRPAAPPKWVLPPASDKKAAAAGLLHLSDLHVGEVIRPEEIGGLNEYNPDIFVRRIRRAFSATVEILPRWSADTKLSGICVAVNGDLVSGDIHDELRRSNALTAHEQVYLATDEICAGIAQLADAFGAVMAVFTPGNHGRTTEKTHAKRVSALSYDTLIGEQVRRHFADDPRITVIVASGPDAVYPLLGWTVFQSHGDALGTGGGKGFAGVSLPIARGAKSVEWQAARVRRHYDIILTAHYHSKCNPSGDAYGNGSVVGYSEYANRIRASVEPAQQWLLLVHSKWGVRETCSIKLEDPLPPPMPRVRVPAQMARASS